MNEDFVTYELAVKLKEKGFDYPCIGHYVNNQLYIAHYQNAFHSDNDESVDAPTISQVLKWLRTEHKIYIYVERDTYHLMFRFVYEKDKPRGKFTSSVYDDFEQAAFASIEYVLDNSI